MRNSALGQAKSGFVQTKHEFISGEVLDIGCGETPYKRVFYNHEDKEWLHEVTGWTGLDIRPVGDIEADVCEMSEVEDESYDTVLCVDVLHEVVMPEAAVAQMWRVLKPGGSLLIAVRNTWPDDNKTLRTFKGVGLRVMLNAVTGVDPEFLSAGGQVVRIDRDAFMHQTKYAIPMSDPVMGFLDGLCDRYPLMTYAIVTKEIVDDDQETAA